MGTTSFLELRNDYAAGGAVSSSDFDTRANVIEAQLLGALSALGAGVLAVPDLTSWQVTAGTGLSVVVAAGSANITSTYNSVTANLVVKSGAPVTISGLTASRGSGAPIYIWAETVFTSSLGAPDSRRTQAVNFVASLTSTRPNALLLATVTTSGSAVLVIDNTVRTWAGLPELLFRDDGPWDSAKFYYENNVVEDNGSAWRALQNSLNQAPPTLPTTSNAYWTLLASKGDDGLDGAGYAATSTSSLAIGTGSKTFTTQSGLAYSVGARVRATDSADTTKWMEGVVTSYSGTSLVVSMDATHGSGTIATWNLNVAGEPGTNGTNGAGYLASSTSSLTIGTGSKDFTVLAGLAYSVGARVRATDSADVTKWMEGVVTAYSGTTLTVNVDLVSGSGTIATWNINVTGERGTNGTNGAGYGGTSTSSLTVGTGSKTFVLAQSGLAYQIGARVRATDSSGTGKFMEGSVTSYSGTTLILSVDLVNGSGTVATWSFNVVGERGTAGADGADGSVTEPDVLSGSITLPSLDFGDAVEILATHDACSLCEYPLVTLAPSGARVSVLAWASDGSNTNASQFVLLVENVAGAGGYPISGTINWQRRGYIIV